MSKKDNPLLTKTRERKRLQLHFNNDGLTQQHFKEETDINNIMAKFAKTGLVDHVNKVAGSYGDFTTVQDYQLHLDQVMAANAAFMELPSKIRARFDNDPSHLLAFVQDPRNRDEAVELGLIDRPPPPPPKDAPASSGAPGGGDQPPTPPAKPAAS